jgi:hypothetical protein
MSGNPVHFELFIRRRLTGPWLLELATEDRTRALETAHAIIAEGSAVSVRVQRETLNTKTGEYSSATLLLKGDPALPKSRGKGKAPPTEPTVPCVEVRDLYAEHARELIGRLLAPWLQRQRVTPFELLHRSDLLESLEASGMEMQHAIQKVAIPEAQATGATSHDVIRRYQKTTGLAIERVIRDARRNAFPLIRDETFAEVGRRLSKAPDGAYFLGGAIAQHIAPAKAWPDKLDRLLELADRVGAEARDFTFGVLCQPLAEILGSRGALSEISGAVQDLGGELTLLTRLIAPSEVAQLLSIDPSLNEHFPAPAPQILKLAEWLQNPGFLPLRAALARRVLAELNGSKRLRPGDAQGEITVLRALAMALTLFAGPLAPPDDVHAAFVKRSAELVSPNFIEAYTAGAVDALSEIRALIRLGENVAGALNKRSVGRCIAAAVTAIRFETELRTGPAAPDVKLAALVDLQRQLGRIGLPEWDSAYISNKLGEVGGVVEAETRYIASIIRISQSRKTTGARLNSMTVLAKLAQGESAPQGPVPALAKAELQKLLRDPAVRTDLAGSPDVFNLVKDGLTERQAG